MTHEWREAIGIFLMMAGFIIGLGAVTVIDLHGFLGRKSRYWTEATTGTHKVTKPMIWAGTVLAILGGVIRFSDQPLAGEPLWLSCIAVALVLNGCFLSFSVSPYLLARERAGKSADLLPAAWQRKITVSFLISVFGWWGAVLLFVKTLI